jgi:hypothetical protein
MNSELGRATTKTYPAERSISIDTASLQVCLGNGRHGILACFTARGQLWRNMAKTGDKKVFCVLKVPKLCQLWRRNGGFRPSTMQNQLWTKQFVSGTRNSSTVAVCALLNGQLRPLFFFCGASCYRYQLPERAASVVNATITGRYRGFHFSTRQSPATLPFWLHKEKLY